jgi:hypothetical protein
MVATMSLPQAVASRQVQGGDMNRQRLQGLADRFDIHRRPHPRFDATFPVVDAAAGDEGIDDPDPSSRERPYVVSQRIEDDGQAGGRSH